MDKRFDRLTGIAVARHNELWNGSNDAHLKWLMDRSLFPRTIWSNRLGITDSKYGRAISIPYFNPPPFGGVRLNRLRYLDPEAPNKYYTPKGHGSHIYRVENVDQDKVWVTEGEFDCLILEQLGYPAIAIPGTHSFRPEWAYLFVDTQSVTVVADGDEPGEAAAMRVASIIGPYTDVSVLKMPDGEDINSLYTKDSMMLRRLLEG